MSTIVCQSANANNCSSEEDKPLMLLRENISKILYDFFVSSFTSIILRRGLCPKSAFTPVQRLGMQVPALVHPQGIEYVEGICHKVVALLRQNALEGCVFHVKEGRVYFRQRFVFKIEGCWNLQREHVQRSELILEDLKHNCQSCLHILLSCTDLQRLWFPLFSRWSISVGIKREYMDIIKENGVVDPFRFDPDCGHFPWKRRSRPLGKAQKVATRLDFSFNQDSDSKEPKSVKQGSDVEESASGVECSEGYSSSPDLFENSFVSELADKTDTENRSDTIMQDKNTNELEKNSNDEEDILMDVHDLEDMLNGSDVEVDSSFCNSPELIPEDDLENDKSSSGDKDDEEDDVLCKPIITFPILDGLLLNVFVLDYSKILDNQIKRMGEEKFLLSSKGS